MILLTGCAGFIGHFVGKKLLEQGYKVIGIDNLNDYYDVNLKKWRLQQLKENKNFEFWEVDIENKSNQ
jgi:nucleoside-diphosphate-sugar epimerase